MLSALILSGGQGSRMGTDKGLVKLGDAPLVRHVADVLTSVADEVLVSVGRGRRDMYADTLGSGFVVVEDRAEGMGPLEGLTQGLNVAKSEYLLVSPCDTPFLKREMCLAIAAAAKGRDGAVPRTGAKHIEPLHGAYRRATCARAFERALASGKRAPTQAYADLDITYIEEGTLRAIDAELLSFWNINSPADLERAKAQLALLR
jgi:molybdopterin-guanine dinucleotide biosynthesis protein A